MIVNLPEKTPLVDQILDDWCKLIERLQFNPDQKEAIISESYSKIVRYGDEFDESMGRNTETYSFLVSPQ